ncbi:hypothetical protein [Phenylobacterium sp.]|jgi:hypothetical protein|uniref:hypothetical protein n=1 Tax=Phenylobacterium sp. TaxID=1871053 RepID=UPI002F934D26
MGERTITDLDVYQKLTATAEALEAVSLHAMSLVGETALKTAADTIRGMANAVYEHSLTDDANAA